MKIVCIIPARGGSRGLVDKNIRLLCGKPLIAYTIEAAKLCPLVNRVIVSTDSIKIASVAKEHGAEVPFMRPSEISGDEALADCVLIHCLGWLEEHQNYVSDICVYLQPTDLFRQSGAILRVIEALCERPDYDSAFLGYATHKNFWKKSDGGGFIKIEKGIANVCRQKKQALFREDTGVACAFRPGGLERTGSRIGQRAYIVPNDDWLSGIDIHTEMDLMIAEAIIRGVAIPNHYSIDCSGNLVI